MTKKRFKLSMAALGLLAAFFMALIALLLAPNLASANRDAGMHHHGGKPGTGYPHAGSGAQGFAANLNKSGQDHGNAFDTPFCVDGGVYPCTVFGDTEDAFDGAGGNSDSYENGYAGGGNPQGGDGSSNGNGRYTPNFWGGGAGGGGGGSGGGAGGGSGGGGQGGPNGEQNGNKAGTEEPGNPNSDDDKTKNTGPEVPLLTLTPPDDDGEPSDFVDPPFGDDEPTTEGAQRRRTADHGDHRDRSAGTADLVAVRGGIGRRRPVAPAFAPVTPRLKSRKH